MLRVFGSDEVDGVVFQLLNPGILLALDLINLTMDEHDDYSQGYEICDR